MEMREKSAMVIPVKAACTLDLILLSNHSHWFSLSSDVGWLGKPKMPKCVATSNMAVVKFFTGFFFRARGGTCFNPEILRQTHIVSWSKWSSVPLKWTYKMIQITNESYVHHCVQLILLHKFSLQSHQTWQQSGKIAIYCNTMWYSYFSNQFAPVFLGPWGFLGLNLQIFSA